MFRSGIRIGRNARCILWVAFFDVQDEVIHAADLTFEPFGAQHARTESELPGLQRSDLQVSVRSSGLGFRGRPRSC